MNSGFSKLVPHRAAGATLCLLAALVAAGGSATAADWLSWRGPNHTGESFESGLPSSVTEILWRKPYGGRSTPVIMDGRIFIITSAGEGVMEQERVMALDLETGEPVWEHRFNIFHTDVPSARVGWANPVIDPETGNLYAHGVQGLFYCFDRDGKILWENSLTETVGRISGYGGRTNSPIIDEDQVVLSFLNSSFGPQGPGSHRYVSFDKHTGAIRWWSQPGGTPEDTTYSVPVVAVVNGQRQLIAGNADGFVYGLKVRTGEKIWAFRASQRGINSSVVVDGYKVYATHSEENIDSTAMGRVVCIDARGTGDVTKTHEIWRRDDLPAGYTSPLLHGDRLYVVTNSGVVYCLNAETGEENWRFTAGRVGKGSPVWADGKIYLAMVNSEFVILEDLGNEARLVDSLAFESDKGVVELFGSPAVSNGRVVFFTTEEIVCLGAKNARVTETEPPALPREPSATGAQTPTHIQIRPAEILTKPGETSTFTAVGFDEHGRETGEIDANWSYEGPGASIDENGRLRATGNAGTIGTITAKSGDVSGSARVRIVPELPISEDFESYAEDGMLSWWIGVSKAKFAMGTIDGSRVLKKTADDRGPTFNRSQVYVTPPLPAGYTVEADLMGTKVGRNRGDIGLINCGYRFEMFGNVPRIRIMSWVPGPRFEKRMDYTWEPDRWYRAKFRVDLADGKAYPKIKVWPRGEPEPDAWTIEAEDPQPNVEGSGGIYAYSLAPVYFDNVRIYD